MTANKYTRRVVRFTYTNWRGETSTRTVLPVSIIFGSTEYHPEEQWLLIAHDLDKQAERTFAIKDISDWRPDADRD